MSLITLVMAAACTKNPELDKNEEYKRTELFAMDESVLEGDEIVFTCLLTDAGSTPLADKDIRIVIKKVRTVSGITGRNGQAIIRTEPIPAGTYTCRVFLMETTNIILHIGTSNFKSTKEKNKCIYFHP